MRRHNTAMASGMKNFHFSNYILKQRKTNTRKYPTLSSKRVRITSKFINKFVNRDLPSIAFPWSFQPYSCEPFLQLNLVVLRDAQVLPMLILKPPEIHEKIDNRLIT